MKAENMDPVKKKDEKNYEIEQLKKTQKSVSRMKFYHYTYIGPLNDKRCRAFSFEAMQYGISLRDDCMIESGNWEIEAGHTGVKRLLALTQRPTAVFAAADRLAFGIMHELQDAGLRIPCDISVAGYDNLPESQIIYPSLTTVDINKEGTGRLAVQLLLERIRNPQRENVIHTLPTKLIVRKSTGKVIKQ